MTEADFVRALSAPWTGPRQVGDGRPFWRHVVQTATGCSDPDYFERLYAWYARPDAWTVRPGYRELLDRAPAVGIVSNFDTRLRPLLEGLALRFDVLACSGELGVEKPDPRIFEHALRELGVPPQGALMVGDSPAHDVEAALALGCDAVLVGETTPETVLERLI